MNTFHATVSTMDASVEASGASVNCDEFEDTPEDEFISLRSDNEPMDDHVSKSPSRSSLGNKSFKKRVNDKLDFLTNQVTDFMSKCKISKNQTETKGMDEPVVSPISVEITSDNPDLLNVCRSIHHITTLFPFFSYQNNNFVCNTCADYVASNATNSRVTPISYNSVEGIDFCNSKYLPCSFCNAKISFSKHIKTWIHPSALAWSHNKEEIKKAEEIWSYAAGMSCARMGGFHGQANDVHNCLIFVRAQNFWLVINPGQH
jgi:hypothetical protein